MQLVEQHIISRSDPRYAVIAAAAFKSKNLYNAALYEMRQAFIFQGKRLSYKWKSSKRATPPKPVFLILTPLLPTSRMLRRNTPLAGRGLDVETVCIVQKTDGSFVPM
jgi:hypothetical protein